VKPYPFDMEKSDWLEYGAYQSEKFDFIEKRII